MAKKNGKLGKEEILANNIFVSRQERSDNGSFDVRKRLEDLIENSETTGYYSSISDPSVMIPSEIEAALLFRGYDQKSAEIISGRKEVAPEQLYTFERKYHSESNVSERVLRLGSKLAIKLHPYDRRKTIMGSYSNALSFLGLLDPSQSLSILQSISDIVTLSTPQSFDAKGIDAAKGIREMFKEISDYSCSSMESLGKVSAQFGKGAERDSYLAISSISSYRDLKKIVLSYAQKLVPSAGRQKWFSEEMQEAKKGAESLNFGGLMHASRKGEHNFSDGLSWMEKEYGMRILGLNYSGNSVRHITTNSRSAPSKLTIHYADNRGVHTHAIGLESEGSGIAPKAHIFLIRLFSYLDGKSKTAPFSNYASMTSHAGIQIGKHS